MRSRLPRKNTGFRWFAYLVAVVIIGIFIIFNGVFFRLSVFFIESVTLPRTEELEMLPKNVLAARVVESEKKVSRTRYQAVLYETIVAENIRLKELLGLTEYEDVILGRVIARPPRTLYDTLLVKVFNSDNISVGDYVFFNKLLLGEVSQIEGKSVKVTLLSNPDTLYDVFVGSPQAMVTLRGLGGGSFVFSIPNEILVSPGDVVTSATDKTLVVGVVETVKEKEDSTNKTVLVHTTVSFSDIDFVSFRSP